MSRRRLNTILKLAANTSEENVNAMPTLVTSPQNKDVPVDLPILTYEDIMNSEIIFEYTENNIKDFPDFETVSTSQVTNIASTSQQSCYEHSIVVSADSSVNNVEENDINLFTDCFINDTLVTMDDDIENEILVNSNGESNLVNCDKKN